MKMMTVAVAVAMNELDLLLEVVVVEKYMQTKKYDAD